MNKTTAFIMFGVIAVVGLVGAIILIRERPDASATFINLLVTVLTMAAVAGGLSVAIGKQGNQIEEVRSQTNGTLSKRDAKIAEQEAELIELRAAAARQKGAHAATGGIPTV